MGIKVTSVTGFGASTDKKKVYEGLKFKEEILKIEGALTSSLNHNLLFSSTTRFGENFDFSWSKLNLTYPADWFKLKGSGVYGTQTYDRNEDGKEEAGFGINKLTSKVQINLEKTSIKGNFTYGPNFEDIDEDGAKEKVSDYAHKKTKIQLSTSLGNFKLSHNMVLKPGTVKQRFRVKVNMNDWVPGLELQFSQTKLQKLIFSLTTKF